MIKWLKTFFLTILIRISLALKNIDDDLRANVADLFRGNIIEYKKRHRNPVLNKMEQGQQDERYTQQFYEILKKADEFVRSTNPDKAAKVADRHGVNIGAKDKWGMRWDHHGFLDPKHKYYGKTLKEIRDIEIQERKLKDDDYPILVMFTNKAELSFVDALHVLKEKEDSFQIPELSEMAQKQKFPLMVVRSKEVKNKIEQLAEFVHVKSVSSKHFIIELFIPAKYKLKNFDNETAVFRELIEIEQIWFQDDYGDKHAYRVTEFYKRGTHIDYVEDGENKYRYDVIKFKGEIIEELK